MSWAVQVLAILGATAALVVAQQPFPAHPPIERTSPLRIAVDLVQVDAVVTDNQGRHVTDLTAADFEILQNGRLQTLSAFTYVNAAAPGAASHPSVGARPLAFGPTAPLAPGKVQRTIAIVVDDLGLSFEGTARVREVLRQFIERDVQPGDLVAILRTGAGMGALQQFTTDRRMLDAAVDRVRWNFMTRSSIFQSFGGGGAASLASFRNEYFVVGTLGAIQYVARGVAELPGRKSIVVLSEGFGLCPVSRVESAFRGLVDAANRAGVVIYTIDARGLTPTGVRADDRLGEDVTPEMLEGSRRAELRNRQDALAALADETGGLFVRNTNDIAGGLRRALDDQQGYYLLGYVPPNSTFSDGGPRVHSLRVRVKRPGLRVRSRRSFIGRPDTEPPLVPAQDRMAYAVTSPFAGGDMNLRLTSLFGYVEKAGAVVDSFMHMDARELTFAEQLDGRRSADVEVLAVTFGDNGEVADRSSRRYTVTLTADGYEQALQRGFVYTTRVPIKKPGPYQLRIAVRDVKSDRIGSASHFVDVPDVKKGHLTLSGLVIQGSDHANRAAADADGAVDDAAPNATVAVRMFRQGAEATYLCAVYNAKRESSGQPQLESQIRLFRDGREVFRSASPAIEFVPQDRRILAAGMLGFGKGFPPGSYVLELTVTDRLAKKNARATQTIDFDVVAGDYISR
jgi:VWFA-related protein